MMLWHEMHHWTQVTRRISRDNTGIVINEIMELLGGWPGLSKRARQNNRNGGE